MLKSILFGSNFLRLSKKQITVLNDSEEVDELDVQETDMNKVKNRKKRANRMKDELYMKRVQAMNSYYGRNSVVFCIKNTEIYQLY